MCTYVMTAKTQHAFNAALSSGQEAAEKGSTKVLAEKASTGDHIMTERAPVF